MDFFCAEFVFGDSVAFRVPKYSFSKRFAHGTAVSTISVNFYLFFIYSFLWFQFFNVKYVNLIFKFFTNRFNIFGSVVFHDFLFIFWGFHFRYLIFYNNDRNQIANPDGFVIYYRSFQLLGRKFQIDNLFRLFEFPLFFREQQFHFIFIFLSVLSIREFLNIYEFHRVFPIKMTKIEISQQHMFARVPDKFLHHQFIGQCNVPML